MTQKDKTMKVIFVCTGNTCRSPMAKVLFRKLLRDRGIDLIEVDSAGLACYAGEEASPHAVEAMRERGLDLSDHRSRPCSAYLLQEGVFVGMTEAHCRVLQPYLPPERLMLLGSGIPDPYGGSLEDYRACAARIEQTLPAVLRKVVCENTVIMPMAVKHIDDIAALEQECFSTPWSKQSLEEELTNEAAHFLTAVFDGRVIGYLGILEISGESDITNVAVSPAYRRLGVADKLLDTAVTEAKTRGDEWITLEVRESNKAAQALYQKHGFAPIGERISFYTKPVENAVLMRKLLREKQDEDISH